MKTIVAGVDGSFLSLKAAKMAAEIAARTAAKLFLVHVKRPIALSPAVYGDLIHDIDEKHRVESNAILQSALKEIEEGEGLKKESISLVGSPAESIADFAEAEHADLVVVGSRGQNAVARVLLGNVSGRLAHICSMPVLVVR